MTTTNRILIDFDQILDLAMKGVRRTAVFMGLGMNAATNPAVSDFSLEGHSFVRLVPEGQATETVARYKDEFGKWIVGFGLRELLEHFETFLTALFDACMITAIKAGLRTQADAEKKRNEFTRGGLGKKVAVLDQMGITGIHTSHFTTLYDTRNCLTHRHGLVGPEDCNDPTATGNLVVTWRGFTVEVHEPSGNVIPLTSNRCVPQGLPVLLPEGGNLVARVLERRLEFPLGSVVDLSPGQVAEICAFVIHEAQAIVASAVAFVEGTCGIPVRDNSAKNVSEIGGAQDDEP